MLTAYTSFILCGGGVKLISKNMTALLPQDIVGVLFRFNKLVQMGMYNFRHTTSLSTQNFTFTQIVLVLRYILDQERTLFVFISYVSS